MAANEKRPLSVSHPEIAAQAHGWDPTEVTAGSNTKREWICGFGHTWSTTTASRTAGTGCPFCSGRQAIPGLNDLATINCELAAQALGWDPTTVTSGSSQKRLWICPLGHTWNATIASRTTGTGCPVCAGKSIVVGFNDLATTHPLVAAQANGWDPKTVTAGRGHKREWICHRDHVWTATIASRAKAGRGCPICSGKSVLQGFNDLGTTRPDLAAQAHGWDPTTITAGSSKKREWICDLGHAWTATVTSRTYMKTGCPYCVGKKVLAGFNDLVTTHPVIAAQAHRWDPTTVSAGSHKQFEWQCEYGHIWISTAADRTRGQGCAFCSGKQINIGFNDLATTHPELAARAHGWDPTTVTAGSDQRREWECEFRHVWTAQVKSRTNQGSGCPFCSGNALLEGFNDLATTHPFVAAQAHGWDPSTLTAGTQRRRVWKCELGHVWTANVANRAIGGRGCPICAGKTVLAGFNDLATTHPELAKEASGWDPTTVTSGSGQKLEWQCTAGHKWTSGIASRAGNGRGCPICAGKTVLAGFNDLATTHPELAKEASGWDPTTVTSGSGQKLEWQCTAGHKWTTTVSHRTRGQGCPTCSPSGFDPNSPGWVYLLQHDGLQLLQIGISNSPENRIATHSRRGWEPLDLIGPIDGPTARDIEQSFLRYLDGNSIPRASAFSDPFDGYSEAWREEDLRVTSLAEVRDLIRKQDDGSTA